jgi:hypothetical protein
MAAGGNANLAWLVDDTPDEAAREADAAIALWTRAGFHLQHWWHAYARAQTELYQGDAPAAAARLAACWPRLRAALLLRVQHSRVEALQLRARIAVALAARAGPAERGALARAVQRDARRLRDERGPYSQPYSEALLAALDHQAGHGDAAQARLARAVEGFERAEMRGYAAAARRRLGELTGGARGAALVAQADGALGAERVRRADRFAAMLVPGFDRG